MNKNNNFKMKFVIENVTGYCNISKKFYFIRTQLHEILNITVLLGISELKPLISPKLTKLV